MSWAIENNIPVAFTGRYRIVQPIVLFFSGSYKIHVSTCRGFSRDGKRYKYSYIVILLSQIIYLAWPLWGTACNSKQGYAISRFGLAMGANGLLLHYSSNAEIVGCLEGSNTAKQSSSGSQTPEGGYVFDGIQEWNSLVDLADFAPYVPCGMRNQCLSIIRHSASSLGRCIRVTRAFISS